MKLRMNTFGKVTTLIFSLLLPILLLYAYSHQVSVDVVRQMAEDGNKNRLSFFMSQMEAMIDQLTKYSVVASRDYSIKQYLAGRATAKPVENWQRQTRIGEMLNMQVATSGWNNQLILYMTDSKEVISTDYSARYDEAYLRAAELKTWEHRSVDNEPFFSRFRESDIPGLLVEVRFTDDNLQNMLNLLKQGDTSEPFLYQSGKAPIVSRMANSALIGDIVRQLDQNALSEKAGSRMMELGGQTYMINYIRSESLGWYLIDSVPLESLYAPITVSRNLFYATVALLTLFSLLVTLLLYRHVQRPIQLLLRGVQRMKDGQYSVRLKKQANNEFDYLFLSFNEMAAQIQELIEKVYKETLRSREAFLKQLQSQINPHFLYNCLFYIKNMANLGEKEAVVAMALNLGEYYRYTTRLEKTMTTVAEELRLVENYLTIQSLRMQRFHYEIDIPEAMRELPLPRLLLQPLVENAILHGVEGSTGFGVIQIRGEAAGGVCRLTVEDNGRGATDEQQAALRRALAAPMEETTGCGLWNVHQRLVQLYGGRSGLQFGASALGGFRAELVWEEEAKGGTTAHVSIAAGG